MAQLSKLLIFFLERHSQNDLIAQIISHIFIRAIFPSFATVNAKGSWVRNLTNGNNMRKKKNAISNHMTLTQRFSLLKRAYQ